MKEEISQADYTELLKKFNKPKKQSELGILCPDGYGRVDKYGHSISYAVTVANGYKSHAKKRGYIFTLTLVEAFWLIQKPCEYCGIVKIFPEHNGIDRVDSNLGYTIENTVSCCKWCNYAKNKMTTEEFKVHITNMYNHFVIGREI